MSKVTVDVLVEIRFPMKEGESATIYTNARTDNDALEDILSTWVQHQFGRGEDPSPVIDREVYTIKLGLVVEDDSFCTESDTGNNGLTCGIVVEVLQNLKTIPVKKLSERPPVAA
jgi:hypothetical protein